MHFADSDAGRGRNYRQGYDTIRKRFEEVRDQQARAGEQAGQEQRVSAGDRGRDTGHHEEPGSEQGGSRADSGQSLVEDTSTPASTQEYFSETIKGGLCSRLYWFS